jgi:hypothetical protein
MLKEKTKALLERMGYRVTRIPKNRRDGDGHTLYSYLDENGRFDYEKYRNIQIEGNKRKLDAVWVVRENVEAVADYLERTIAPINFGICHGTRRGKEQEWFREILQCEVIGTEISDSATQFPHTIQWDFHEVKPEWLDAVDFIYSNSFDHSYDPERCLSAWMSCVREGGLCVLEHSSLHGPRGATQLDPFGAELQVMPYLITTWGKGRYGVREILPAPVKREGQEHQHFIVIQRY